MKLNLDKQFLDLKGNPLPDRMDEALANALATSNVGKPARMISWAISLINDGEIDIDKSDVKFLMEFVERHPGLTNLAKGQLLERIEKMEEAQPQTEVNHNSTEDIARGLMRQVNKLA